MANWLEFERDIDTIDGTPPVPIVDNIEEAYEGYCKTQLDDDKKYIPKGCRTNHIPCCDGQCEDLLCTQTEVTHSTERASAFTNFFAILDNKCKKR